MAGTLRRKAGVALFLAAVVLVVAWGFVPGAVPVDLAEVTRGPLRVTVEEQGRTQVRDRYVISAPVAGFMRRITLEAGDPVAMGEPLMDVGDRQDLEVRVEVLSSDAVKLRKGTPVLFERWGGEAPLAGRVRVVEPGGFTKISSLGVEEQRVVVLVDLTTPREVWENLGDAYRLDASFIVWEGGKVLQVPSGAVFRRGAGWAVYVAEGGRARLREVRIGHGNGLASEVVSGLKEGQKVIMNPDDAISEGTRVMARDWASSRISRAGRSSGPGGPSGPRSPPCSRPRGSPRARLRKPRRRG
ncbi:MAG TPA: HlyD family efflux transporter periplasmic adaptor subunit [Deltaproteobacteria bacterium]|jgi:multidrug efflux pump subunit AcrA (membrane-fusion protein)|nr:HlyD family efflux transporter periplasmic adaptor subunit [Deltaproteobacteria bacterium]HOI06010.1 HlyD family efflux transporter periplasmic adaptor subunit [Deltaproteobacteria bacterium]